MIIFVNFETPAPNKKKCSFLKLQHRGFRRSNHAESIGLIESFRNLASRPSGDDEGPSYDHFSKFEKLAPLKRQL